MVPTRIALQSSNSDICIAHLDNDGVIPAILSSGLYDHLPVFCLDSIPFTQNMMLKSLDFEK